LFIYQESHKIRSDQNRQNQSRPDGTVRQNCSHLRSIRSKASCSEDQIIDVFLSNGRVPLTFYYTVLNWALQRYAYIQLF